ncbi:hypothetical protein CCACVL1_21024 [Corchorus capsularis]|uniref:Bromo domain-containing protein n=1 Tax=Corchorus capsularis TaxID=210143 RepID=A0A1R3H8P3_COCAP|nr:hypothetical protein CCACVL1_21024 [Corchorus capsularis]
MFIGEYRRSPRIIELDARKAQQARNRNKGNEICELMDGEELDKGQGTLKQKCGRKKVKVRTVQDLIVNSVEYKVQKTDTGIDEEQLVNAAIVSSGATIPEKRKLELLLGVLQRRDTRKIFAEPVNPEEVEYYYDVIKEPMDFGTIAKKLNEGSYQTLQEFEHDVFLVSNNAMLFNASNTVYYKQARALKELATRLFHALKTDPENFKAEAEASMQRMNLSRRRKAEVYSDNNTSIGIAERGCKAERQSDDSEVEKRQTYKPSSYFLNGNGSSVSAVDNSQMQLKLDEKVGVGYVESIKQFAENLGATAQMVSMKKVESYIGEALKVWNMTTNRQPWVPEMVIRNSAFGPKGIKVAPSIKVPSARLGCQNMSGDKMDIHRRLSDGGRAIIHDTMNITNAVNGGISQPSRRVESLGDFRGKMTQSTSGGFAPSLHLFGNSNGSKLFAGETVNGSSSFGNGGKVFTVNNMDINDAFNGGKGKFGNGMDVRGKVVQPMRGGLDIGAAFKDNAAHQSNGVHLYASFPNNHSGKRKLDFPASWNIKSGQRQLSTMVDAINVHDTVQTTAGQFSLGSKKEVFIPTRFSGASSSSCRPLSQVLTGSNSSQAIDYMSGIGSRNLDTGLCQKEATADDKVSRHRINLEQGGQVSYPFKPVEMGLQLSTGYSFQEQNVSPEMASLLQQKKELDSLCEAPPLEEWLASSPHEHVMGASSKSFPFEFERFQTQSKGESSSRAAAADRCQKQPMLGKELPQGLGIFGANMSQKQPMLGKELPQGLGIFGANMSHKQPMLGKELPQGLGIYGADRRHKQPMLGKELPQGLGIYGADRRHKQPMLGKELPQGLGIYGADMSQKQLMLGKELPQELGIYAADRCQKEPMLGKELPQGLGIYGADMSQKQPMSGKELPGLGIFGADRCQKQSMLGKELPQGSWLYAANKRQKQRLFGQELPQWSWL